MCVDYGLMIQFCINYRGQNLRERFSGWQSFVNEKERAFFEGKSARRARD
jgi:hypothetical protein